MIGECLEIGDVELFKALPRDILICLRDKSFRQLEREVDFSQDLTARD
jgi:hypothetical protein